MAGRGPQTFKKRQKEQQRKEKQQEKLEKRMLRKQSKESGEKQEDDDLLYLPAMDDLPDIVLPDSVDRQSDPKNESSAPLPQ